jgi:hypothetical protein
MALQSAKAQVCSLFAAPHIFIAVAARPLGQHFAVWPQVFRTGTGLSFPNSIRIL